MCGIIGYVGNRNVADVLIEGLKSLEYRGYDSSGMSLLSDNVITTKSVGKVINLEKKINKDKIYKLGIAHTRWATHGGVTKENSHPHVVNNITIVHNGIIENYQELKEMLTKKGYTFISETDTEVAAALIDSLIKDNDILDAIYESKKIIRGSYAFLIIYKNQEKIYALRKNSPLIVGVAEEECFLTSDIAAVLSYTNKYMEIDEDEIFELTKDQVNIYKNKKLITKDILTEDMSVEKAQKNGYNHFMLKEINEQKYLGKKIVEKYYPSNNFSEDIIDISKYKYIDIVACGSAYYAGCVGKYLLDKYSEDTIVSIDVASEYRYKVHHYKKETLVILISQSGETADTIAAMRMAHDNNIETLAIVNNRLSTICKEAKYSIPMIAGPEIAVATTKGYFTQVIILNLLVLKFLESKKLFSKEKINKEINSIRLLEKEIENLLNIDYKKIAEKIKDSKDIYFIGRAVDYTLCLEASLKLKEISYIHSDVYQAGELKHGPIALIEKGTPVIALITEKKLAEKTISNVIEAKARGAKIIVFKTKDINISKEVADYIVNIENKSEFSNSMLTIVPFQLLAYYVALLNGCDIDKPKNLAKSVTVE